MSNDSDSPRRAVRSHGSGQFDLSLSAVRMRKRFRKPLEITIHAMVKHASRLCNLVLYPGDRIALIAPAYNEEGKIGRVVEKWPPSRPDWPATS